MGKTSELSNRRLSAETAEVRDPQSGASRVSSDEPRSYLPGEVIDDRYRLEREIGRGGMGVVWVAHSLVLGVDVAVKLIRASETGPEGASRMAREANAAARVGHPALVRVFDFGWTPHGDPFLVMELIHGESLSETIARQKRIPAIRAVQTLLPIADGLRVAHERSIVHRDIKPANILVSTDAPSRQQPTLLDFGIAKVGPNIDGKLTQVGTVLGSPEYMSPEQALGIEDVDKRTDVWSLSIALYEMITGEVPFKRGNYNALMQAIIHDPPQPTTQRGAGDAALWAIINRGLAKDRDARWADMNEFGHALAKWLYDHGIKEDISGNSVRAVWLHEGLSNGHEPKRSSLPVSREATEQVDTVTAWRTSATRLKLNRWLRKQPRMGIAAFGLVGVLVLAVSAGVFRGGAMSNAAGRQGLSAEPQVAAQPDETMRPLPHSASTAVTPTVTPANALPAAGAPPDDTANQAKDTATPGTNNSSRKAPASARKGPLKPKPKSKRDFGF